MLPYESELSALTRANRLRERQLFDPTLHDFASNDYLGLAHRKASLTAAYRGLRAMDAHAPKASPLINGYHPVHRALEEELCAQMGFEKGVLFGSGFLANVALFEALVRQGDLLLLDAEYHASGILGSQLLGDRVRFFAHNDPGDLQRQLKAAHAKRIIVAFEGVYSMSGAVAPLELYAVAREAEAIVIVDEAHSSGVLGGRLRGWYEHQGITPGRLDMKLGTLGKAYGSYGAFVLCSHHLCQMLENRAKPLIYSTALSLFDTMLALENVRYIQDHFGVLRKRVDARLKLAAKRMGQELRSPILALPLRSSQEALAAQKRLLELGYVVGAIRPPTLKRPQLRVILRASHSLACTQTLLSHLVDYV